VEVIPAPGDARTPSDPNDSIRQLRCTFLIPSNPPKNSHEGHDVPLEVSHKREYSATASPIPSTTASFTGAIEKHSDQVNTAETVEKHEVAGEKAVCMEVEAKNGETSQGRK